MNVTWYFPKGWNIFNFIITPDELREVFGGFHHVIYNRRVADSYTESDPSDFFESYKMLYEKLSTGYRFIRKDDRQYFEGIHIGLSDDLSKCAYGEPYEKDTEWYKSSNFLEPCVGVSPLAFFLSKEEKTLSIKGLYTSYPEYTVGLSIMYPKKVIFYKQNNEVERTVDCIDIDTYKVYQEIMRRIKAISKSLRFTSECKEFKPSVKISNYALNDFSNFYFYKENNCAV